MNVFLGFDASNEELGLKAQSIWAFTTNDSGKNENVLFPDPPNYSYPQDLPNLQDLLDLSTL